MVFDIDNLGLEIIWELRICVEYVAWRMEDWNFKVLLQLSS